MKGFLPKNTSKVKTAKKQHVLFFFLGISFLFWLMTNLSKNYVSTVNYRLTYTNLPASKLFQNHPEESIELSISASGFQLLKENLFTKSIQLDLKNVTRKDTYRYYLLTRQKQKEIQKQLGKNIGLIGATHDSLFFELGFNKIKKIPIVLDIDINYKSGYNIEGTYKMEPDSIQISGPETQVDKLTSIATERFSRNDVYEAIDEEVSLLLPTGFDKIKFAQKQVRISGEVDKFTEDSFSVPFSISGLPDGLQITTYPKKIQVVFQVGVRNYKKISAEDFKVVCDFATSQKENVRFLVPKLVEKPEVVSSVKLVPNHVEYLIQK